MQNKKKLHKHLIIIYILYVIILVAGFMFNTVQSFTAGFTAGMMAAGEDMDKNEHSYYVMADVRNAQEGMMMEMEGLPEHIAVPFAHLHLRVTEPGTLTIGEAFRVQADSICAYVLLLISGLSFLAVFVLIALMINSLRKSIRDELPLRHSNILRTRIVGGLLILTELCNAFFLYIHQCKAAELLVGTPYEVMTRFPINYWNLIVGLLFLFMAEVLAIGTQLSEEQKLTI